MKLFLVLLLTPMFQAQVQKSCEIEVKYLREEVYVPLTVEGPPFYLPKDEPDTSLFTSGCSLFPKYGKCLNPSLRNETNFHIISLKIIQEVSRCLYYQDTRTEFFQLDTVKIFMMKSLTRFINLFHSKIHSVLFVFCNMLYMQNKIVYN